MIIEKISQDEILLYEILRNPVLFAEFVLNLDRDEGEEPFELTDYQKEFILDFSHYVSIACARAIGKTVSLSILIVWALVFKVFDEYILYTVPSKVHLEPVFANLVRLFRTNSFLSKFIEPKTGVNHSDFSIRLLNGSRLICRIAGQTGTGANVIGLHTPFILLDEAGYYPWATFMELQPVLNTWQRGFRMIVSGVPTGLREHNVLYHCDIENSAYSKHRVSAFQNPRFTEADRKRAIEQYGGEDSDDYIHFILGQHGKPTFSVFDRANFAIETYPVYKMSLDGTNMALNDLIEKIMLIPPLPQSAQKCIFGIDLGYSEPTAIVILYEDQLGQIFFHARIKMTRVTYPIQQKIIDLLDSKFNPARIAIDRGNIGMAVIQELQESSEFSEKNYKERIMPVDFAANITIGYDSEGREISYKTKIYSISVLQELANTKRLVFSSTDLDIVSELERMTYKKDPNGNIVYSTLTPRGAKGGEDHFTSALLCASLAYQMERHGINAKKESKRLFKPFWL